MAVNVTNSGNRFCKPTGKRLRLNMSLVFQIDDILKKQDWTFPIPIAYGPDRFYEIGKLCNENEIINPLIVTDKGSYDLPFISSLQRQLGVFGIASCVFSDFSPNPRDTEVLSGKSVFNTGAHDAVIAIGGGSAMDGGKSICLTANNNINLWAFEWEERPAVIHPNEAFPKLITIPTTAGTGAETESTAMITHSERGMKFCIFHPQLKPSLALLDPKLTLSLPRDLTAWTGADAMIHAIEAYLVPGFHPLCDAIALEALSLVSHFLPLAVKEPDNTGVRGGMLAGSCLAGIAFAKGLGLVHAISHMVGAEYDTQHGLTNAILLPPVLRFNLAGQELKVKRMAEAMGLVDKSKIGFIDGIEKMLDEIGIPRSLSEIGVPLDCAARIAEKALKDSAAATNPRQADIDEVRYLIETCIVRAR